MSGLTDEQIHELKSTLRAERTQLLEAIHAELLRSDEESYTELAGRVYDIGDQSAADLLADLDLAAVDRELNELRDVEGALARFAQGGYGRCEDCGADIGYERLRAYPTARRCLSDQRRREQQYVHPQTPTL